MPTNDWMNEFSHRADLTLSDITFPASHDAGLSKAPDCYYPINQTLAPVATFVRNAITPTQRYKSAKQDTICQQGDIRFQLDSGSRAFDVRCALRLGVPRTIHAEGGAAGKAGGGYGQTVESIATQIREFLVANPSEIVILRISHTSVEVADRVRVILNLELPTAYRFLSDERNLAAVPLNQLRGKCLIIFHADALPETRPRIGFHRFARYDPQANEHHGLHFCGDYAGFFGKTVDIAMTAFRAGNAHAAPAHGATAHRHLFMVYWQEAFDVEHKTVEGGNISRGRRVNAGVKPPEQRLHIDLYQGVHYNLPFLLNVHRGTTNAMVRGVRSNCTHGNRRAFQPNWINLDFINPTVCERVIAFNREMLGL